MSIVNLITISTIGWWPPLYLQISTLSSCPLICCRCAISQPGWSPACIFLCATPSDSSRLWRALPLWPTAATYHPRLFPRSLFPIATITCSIWALSEKAKLPVKVSRSDFFGRDKESLEKVDRSTAENDLFVCGDAGEVFCPHLHCDSVWLGRRLGSMLPLLAAYRYTWEWECV